MTETQGWTADGFEGVKDAFESNLSSGKEVGAAFSAYHKGKKVADLWGGVKDKETGTPWVEDTMMLVFSTTKGATAMCANKLAQEGHLDVDAPVANYWPEFAQAGKAEMPVSYLLSHQAGLAWTDGSLTTEQTLAWDPVVELLASEEPKWEPGSEHGYHAITFGWLVGEIVKRVSGKSVGTYFREEIAAPLDLEFWIGLPESEDSRVGVLESMIPGNVTIDGLSDPGDDPFLQAIAAFLGPETMLGKALFAPGGALSDQDLWNSRQVRAAEVPAANGVGTARSLAKLYASCIGEVDGVRTLNEDQLKAATVQQTEGPNKVLMGMDIQFGLGFMLYSSLLALGGTNSFGHFGAGGSLGWADPDAELSFGYIMNKMDLGLAGDERSYGLVNACYEAIA